MFNELPSGEFSIPDRRLTMTVLLIAAAGVACGAAVVLLFWQPVL